MRLSKRLECVASFIDKKVRVIDVGCDHGYLSIYLTLYNDNKCIATDINKNALSNAIKNISDYNLEKEIETKLTDGIKGIKIGKNDTIVISGMGTHTILDILDCDKLPNTLVISSNNHLELLRREIIKKGYYIIDEKFVEDRKKFYCIIKFKKGYRKYKNIDYILGPILKNNRTYKTIVLNKYSKVYKKIPMYKLGLKLKYRLLLFKIKRA